MGVVLAMILVIRRFSNRWSFTMINNSILWLLSAINSNSSLIQPCNLNPPPHTNFNQYTQSPIIYYLHPNIYVALYSLIKRYMMDNHHKCQRAS